MKEYRGKIRLVVKHFPYRYRDFSQMASEAALSAGDQGKFWEMHHLLLRNSPRLDRGSLLQYAGEIGLNVKKFTGSLDGRAHSGNIERDRQLALSLGIYSTPTVFINGRRVIGERPYEYFRRIVEEELAASR
jgi:protein-disulfide isomerase